MQDMAKKIQMSDCIKGDFVKGRTRIILTNVKTGEKKVIEHENTFQSEILAKQLRSFGIANNNPFANTTWAGLPLWRNLCGGILLFRDAIDLTGGAVEYMPPSNAMIANGAFGISNSGTPTELGSYNSIESATDGANALSFVYDWDTSHGNGTIGCVCLTSELGGFIGYGNASGDAAANKRSILSNQNSGTGAAAQFFYNGKKYRVKEINMSAKTVKIGVANDRLTVASIFQSQNESDINLSYTGDVAGASGYNLLAARCLAGSKFAFARGYGNSNLTENGQSVSYLIFDASNNTLSKLTLTNTSGKSFYACIGQYVSGEGMYFGINLTEDRAGNFYVVATDGTLLKFNSSGVYQATAGSHGNTTFAFGRFTPGIIYTSEAANGSIYVSDGTNSLVTNGTTGRSYLAQLNHNDALDAFIVSGAGPNNVSPYKNPMFLATVNNLQSAVTKDSTQTMKVIYTLTEAS